MSAPIMADPVHAELHAPAGRPACVNVEVPGPGSGSDDTEGDTVCGPPPRAPASSPTALLEAAIAYAGRGWRVIPLQWPRVEHDGTAVCSCWERERCRRACKHPIFKSWPEVASADVELVTRWWRAYPRANVGIATGWQPDGTTYLIVIDEDKPDALAALADEHNEVIPETWTQATGRATGGRHLKFTVPDELMYAVHAIRNRTKLCDGLDVRAHGGLIVAAPSVSIAGVTYMTTHDVEAAPIPSWLFWLIANKRSGSSAANVNKPTEAELASRGWPLDRRIADGVERCMRHPAAIEGDRGDPTTWDLVLQLVRGLVLPGEIAFDLLLKHYNDRCVPIWGERDLQYKVDRAETDKTEAPWAYLLPPPRVEVAGTGQGADGGGPHHVSPSVSSLPQPQTNTISIAAKPALRAEAREYATIEFCGAKVRVRWTAPA